jgi:hypothetical protein
MRSLLGIVLLIGGIVLGYFGFRKLDDNKADIKIGDLEISAKDKKGSTDAWIMMGAGAVAIIGGSVMMARKSS